MQFPEQLKSSVICLMGPTGSGKSHLAMQLVEHFPFEIISVDSAMVYRGMDIGSAKPTEEELKVAPHHLINLRDPAEAYSAANFCEDARREIDDIFSRGKIPLLVGGTMLYFNALQKGLSDLPSADPKVRNKLLAEAEKLGWPALHDRLKKVDAISAARIHPNDAQRIQRALEVFELTGKPLSQLCKEGLENVLPYDVINIAIIPTDRGILHQRIEQRFYKMLEEGFIDEVKALRARGDLTPDLPSMRAVGYRQIWAYLDGEYDYNTMCQKALAATRQLAKRQLTWLRTWPNLHIITGEHSSLLQEFRGGICHSEERSDEESHSAL